MDDKHLDSMNQLSHEPTVLIDASDGAKWQGDDISMLNELLLPTPRPTVVTHEWQLDSDEVPDSSNNNDNNQLQHFINTSPMLDEEEYESSASEDDVGNNHHMRNNGLSRRQQRSNEERTLTALRRQVDQLETEFNSHIVQTVARKIAETRGPSAPSAEMIHKWLEYGRLRRQAQSLLAEHHRLRTVLHSRHQQLPHYDQYLQSLHYQRQLVLNGTMPATNVMFALPGDNIIGEDSTSTVADSKSPMLRSNQDRRHDEELPE